MVRRVVALLLAVVLAGALSPAGASTRGEGHAGPVVRLDRPRVFVMHDSIMYAASDDLRAHLGDHEVHFSGFPGYTVSYAPQLVLRQRYLIDDIVVVSLGTNYLRDEHRFRAGVRDTMDVLSGVDRVIWMTPQIYRPDINEVIDVLEAEARRRPNLELLDWTSEVEARPALTRPNDVHLAPAGESVYAGLIADAVRNGTSYDYAPVGTARVRLRRSGVTIRGVALDPPDRRPVAVQVTVDGEAVADIAPGERPAYRARLAVGNGQHQICVGAIDPAEGRDRTLGCHAVVTANDPVGSIGSVQVRSDEVVVNGWVMDPDGRRPIGIEVLVDGQVRGEALADRIRLDVEAAFDNGRRHGYRVALAIEPGAHEVCVRAHNIFAGLDRTLDCRFVEVA